MTRTDVKLTVLSFVVAGLFACLLVYCGLQVAATHPLVAIKLHVAAGAILVITAWMSLMANAERRAERGQSTTTYWKDAEDYAAQRLTSLEVGSAGAAYEHSR